jgi:hypothetical protein
VNNLPKGGAETAAARRWVLSVATSLALYGIGAGAHHSIAADYDSSRQVTVDGLITRFHFVNPHPFLIMNVDDGSGTVLEWRLEMDNRAELVSAGVTVETLKPGDRIIVTGSLARAQPRGLYVNKLDRPADGFRYEQIGGSPRIVAPGHRN